MRVNVIYEENLALSLINAFEITEQWLRGQYKAKIKTLTPLNLSKRSKEQC